MTLTAYLQELIERAQKAIDAKAIHAAKPTTQNWSYMNQCQRELGADAQRIAAMAEVCLEAKEHLRTHHKPCALSEALANLEATVKE